MTTCESCGSENLGPARFCAACGAPLASGSTPAEVRKTVTVVFSDVVGSTTLGEGRDPESVRGVMSRYFSEMRRVIERQGGTVEKFVGDAVMAVFGIPVVREDDALRAVRAAHEMREVLNALNDELEIEWGVRIAVRTGVSTGEVVAGDASARQTFVTGDAVNTTARLEQAAGSGEVLLGESTYYLVKEWITSEPVEPLSLKGKAEPVPAYRLLGVRATPDLSQHPRGPMVGRQGELAELEEAFAQAVSSAECGLVFVLGAPGIGKSRLVEEFVGIVRNRAVVVRGRCLSYGEGITFWPVAEILKQATGIAASHSPQQARQRLDRLVAGQADSQLMADCLASVLGLADVEVPIQEIFRAVRKALEALARDHVMVVVVEDIQWAESGLLDLLADLARLAHGPILLVCPARPELLEAHPGWAQELGITIVLEPLAKEEAERLVDAAFGGEALAEARSWIAGVAGGNPLFVEEMLRMLFDEELLRQTEGRWEVMGDLSSVSIPASITAVIAARLDRLNRDERAVAGRASVVGQEFGKAAVSVLSANEDSGSLDARLDALCRKEFIDPVPEEFGPQAYSFRHLLIRDEAYRGLTKRVRAELHELLGDWLESQAGERLAEIGAIVGYHLEQAYRYRAELGPIGDAAEALARRAAQRLTSAGRQAFGRDDFGATANLLGRAVNLLPAESPDRITLLPDLGESFMHTDGFERAEPVLSEAIQRAEQTGDERIRWRAHVARAELRLISASNVKYETVTRDAERGASALATLGDETGASRAWLLAGTVYTFLSQFQEAKKAFERAVELARRAGSRRDEVRALGDLAASMVHGPTPVQEAIESIETILEASHGDPSTEAVMLYKLAHSYAMRGSFVRARELMAKRRTQLEDLGGRLDVAGFSHRVAMLEMLAGDPAAAEAELRAGLQVLEAMGAKGYAATSASLLAEAIYVQERYDEAWDYLVMSETAAAPDDVEVQIQLRVIRAKILAQRREFHEAERLARDARRMCERTDSSNLQADTLIGEAEVMRLAGRLEEAVASVQSAMDLYEQKGNLVSAGRARSTLNLMSSGAP